MEYSIIIIVFTIGCALSGPVLHEKVTNGQPGCKTDEELNAHYYPYHDDPQLYWECVRKNSDAECRYCPVGTLFQADLRRCIDVSSYEWIPKVEPPSSPKMFVRFCKISSNRPTNGQPGCKTLVEIQRRYHANPDDITRYWECMGLNEPAICRRCPDDSVFELSQCVKAGTESWHKTSEPESSPDVFVSCY